MRTKSRRFVRRPKRCSKRSVKLGLFSPTYLPDGKGGFIQHDNRCVCFGCLAQCPIEISIDGTLPQRLRQKADIRRKMYAEVAECNAKNKNKKALPDKPLDIDT